MISVLLADDEPLARARLRALLADDPEIDCVGEAGDGIEALAAIRRLRPDLLFLDIQMPGRSGLDLLRALPSAEAPVVVFVTAFDQHAIEAFDLQAIDYLLKPFDVDRFARALRRAKAQVQARRSARGVGDDAAPSSDLAEKVDRLLETLRAERSSPTSRRLVVRDGDRAYFLRDEEIDWIEAEGNYVALHVGAAQHLHREPLKELEGRLDPERFLRIHRSIVVNLDRVREIRPWFHGAYVLVLRDGTELTSGRSYSAQLRAILDGGKSG